MGRATDVDLLDESGRTLSDCASYTRLGEAWESLGGVWGGRFGGFGACGDAGHLEWHPGMSISDVCPDPGKCSEVEATDIPTSRPANFSPLILGAVAGAAAGIAALLLTE